MFRQSAVRLPATQKFSPRRRGIVTLLSAVVLVMLFGIAAFAVETVVSFVTQTDVQRVVDTASVAATQQLEKVTMHDGSDRSAATVMASSPRSRDWIVRRDHRRQQRQSVQLFQHPELKMTDE